MSGRNAGVLGVDPGRKGALALIPASGKGAPEIYDMPEDPYTLATLILNLRPRVAICALEKQHSFPRDGHVGAFTLGEHYGTLKGLLIMGGIPFEEVPARTWQNYFFGGPDRRRRSWTKTMSVSIAEELYPEGEFRRKGRRGRSILLHGRADAVLVAEYLRRKRCGKIPGCTKSANLPDSGTPAPLDSA